MKGTYENGLRAARWCGGFLGLVVACASPPQPLSEAHAAAIQDSVRGMLAAFRAHMAAQRWDSMATMYVDDARFRWIEDGVVRYRSAAEVRQALAGLPPGMQVETTYEDTEIVPLAPGIATVSTLFETRWAMGMSVPTESPTSPSARYADSAGRGFGFGGAITMTLVHEAGGWRFVGGHTSTPKPRSSGPSQRDSQPE